MSMSNSSLLRLLESSLTPEVDEQKELIMNIAGWWGFSFALFFFISPGIMYYKLIKGKFEFSSIPPTLLFFGLANCLLWNAYGFQDAGGRIQVWAINLIGAILEICYGFIWIRFWVKKDNKKTILFYILFVLAIAVIFCGFFVTEYLLTKDKKPEDRGAVAGKAAMVFNILLYASPAEKIVRMIKTYDLNLVPIIVSIIGCVCSCGWVVYGFLRPNGADWNILVPNILGVLFNLTTSIIWFVIYCKLKKKNKSNDQAVEVKDNENKVKDDKELEQYENVNLETAKVSEPAETEGAVAVKVEEQSDEKIGENLKKETNADTPIDKNAEAEKCDVVSNGKLE